MLHSYQRKIWCSNLFLLAVSEILVLVLSFFISRSIFLGNLAESYSQRLYTICDQNEQATEMVKGFVNNFTVDPEILRSISQLRDYDSSWQLVQASRNLYQAINIRQNVCTPVSKIYIKIGRSIYSETSQVDIGPPDFIDSSEVGNIEYQQLLSEQELADFLTKKFPSLNRRQIFFAGIGGEVTVACIPDWNQLYEMKNTEMLYIYDRQGILMHSSSKTSFVDLDGYYLFHQVLSEPSGYVICTADNGKRYIATAVDNSQKYLLLCDYRGAMDALYREQLPLFMIAVGLFLISIFLFYGTSRYVTRPIWSLIDALDGMPGNSVHEGLYPLILEWKRQTSIRRCIYLHSFSTLLPLGVLIILSLKEVMECIH